MRKFWVIISSIIMMIMVILLCLSYSVKKVVVDTLSEMVVKEKGASAISELIYNNLENINEDEKEKIKDTVKNSEYLDDITAKYFEAITKDINKDVDDITSPNIKAESAKMLKECLDIVLEDNKIKLTEKQKQEVVNEFVTDKNLNLIYQKTVTLIQNNSNSKVSELVNTYNFFTSNTLRTILWGILAFCLLIIIVASKPKHFTILAVGLILLFSGLLIAFIVMPVVNFIGPAVLEQITNNSSFKASFLSRCGYLLTGIGTILLLAFYFLNKILVKEKEFSN